MVGGAKGSGGRSGSAAGRGRQSKPSRYVRARARSQGWLWGGLAAVVVVAGITFLAGRGARVPAGTETFPEPNHQHVTGDVQYDRTPPAGGAHSAAWLNCGIYDQPVPNPNAVHSLEHGAVWVTYQPTLLENEITALRHLVQSKYRGPQRYVILSPYPGDPAPIVASAWGAQLRVQSPSDPRLAKFIGHFAGGGQGGEPGAPCTNGTGTPHDS